MADIKEIEKAINHFNKVVAGLKYLDKENVEHESNLKYYIRERNKRNRRKLQYSRVALQVLQEKAEREKGCEYCRNEKKLLLTENTDIRIPTSRSIPQISIEGETYDGYSFCTGFKIDFCPMCGRKLGGKQ
jgi:hypothetical protein